MCRSGDSCLLFLTHLIPDCKRDTPHLQVVTDRRVRGNDKIPNHRIGVVGKTATAVNRTHLRCQPMVFCAAGSSASETAFLGIVAMVS
jgi:low affinity Fe/Cu permease